MSVRPLKPPTGPYWIDDEKGERWFRMKKVLYRISVAATWFAPLMLAVNSRMAFSSKNGLSM